MRRIWPLTLMVLGGCVALRALLPEPRPLGVPDDAVRVPGVQARVVGVAFSDFAADLARQRAQAEADQEPDGGPPPEVIVQRRALWDCTLSPEFYDAWVYRGDAGTSYVVDIWPKPEVCFDPVGESYGGGVVYEIDAKDFTILKREVQE